MRGLGCPVRLVLTAGQKGDASQASLLMEGAPAELLIADAAYDADHIRDAAAEKGTEAVIPNNPSNRDDVYLVLEDFGRKGRAWRETGEERTDRATLIREILEGQYEDPVRIVAFNTAQGWSRDVTVEIADEVRRRFIEYDEAPASLLRFSDAASRH
jgi:transposase